MRGLLADPLILLSLGLLAVLVLHRFAPKAGKLGLGLVALAAYLLSTPMIGAQLLRGLEVEGPVRQAVGTQAIVVLGATLRHKAPEFHGDTVGALTLERLRYGARVHRQTGLPVLVTGGTIGESEKPVGLVMAEALEVDFRTPVRWIEDKARNTFENAKFTTAILKRDGVSQIYLVTHAWHMPRALQAFEKSGLAIVPAPTGFTVNGPGWRLIDMLPSSKGLRASTLALHEMIGRLWYAIRY